MVDIESVFSISDDAAFEAVALETFHRQSTSCIPYKDFLKLIGKEAHKINALQDIPFLPISLFKTHKIITKNKEAALNFKSSGTSNSIRSTHHVYDPHLYIKSFTQSYCKFVGDPQDQIIVALLPNYIEQGESSLVYMVETLIRQSKNKDSRFILSETHLIEQLYHKAIQTNKQFVLFGVSYSLLDFCEMGLKLPNAWVIETGGMKGKRTEIPKEQLLETIQTKLNPSRLYSEYGMTECLSQAYALNSNLYKTPKWMKILVSDSSDPMSGFFKNKTGRINIIDLANQYSCSFIQTEDLGVDFGEGFNLLGRLPNTDIRGCNQLID